MSAATELAAARAHLGLSLEDISKRTKISVERLAAIEAANPDALPALVYVKGFVREYASAVNLDPDSVLARYLAELDEASVLAWFPSEEEDAASQGVHGARSPDASTLQQARIEPPPVDPALVESPQGLSTRIETRRIEASPGMPAATAAIPPAGAAATAIAAPAAAIDPPSPPSPPPPLLSLDDAPLHAPISADLQGALLERIYPSPQEPLAGATIHVDRSREADDDLPAMPASYSPNIGAAGVSAPSRPTAWIPIAASVAVLAGFVFAATSPQWPWRSDAPQTANAADAQRRGPASQDAAPASAVESGELVAPPARAAAPGGSRDRRIAPAEPSTPPGAAPANPAPTSAASASNTPPQPAGESRTALPPAAPRSTVPSTSTAARTNVRPTATTSERRAADRAVSAPPGAAAAPPSRAPSAAASPAPSSIPSEPIPLPSSVVAPPPPGAVTTAPAESLNGDWSLTTRIETSDLKRYANLNLAYRIELKQDGDRVTGRGSKWMENGRRIGPRGRTPIAFEGIRKGNRVELRFTEEGRVRTTSGVFQLMLLEDGSLRGAFASTAANSRGSSVARRLGTDKRR